MTGWLACDCSQRTWAYTGIFSFIRIILVHIQIHFYVIPELLDKSMCDWMTRGSICSYYFWQLYSLLIAHRELLTENVLKLSQNTSQSTLCNTLHHTATHYNTLAPHCTTLQQLLLLFPTYVNKENLSVRAAEHTIIKKYVPPTFDPSVLLLQVYVATILSHISCTITLELETEHVCPPFQIPKYTFLPLPSLQMIIL